MDEPIEEVYFNWLCAKVMAVKAPTPSLTFWKLFRTLHNTEFVWLVPNDDNRCEDGIDLRHEFLNMYTPDHHPEWLKIGCSIFEMLIAFARRAEFDTDQSAKEWFWIFLENLGLSEFNDAYDIDMLVVDDILQRFVWRTYDFDGTGGLFPLRNPSHDQRKVELWYQFSEYLVEQEV